VWFSHVRLFLSSFEYRSYVVGDLAELNIPAFYSRSSELFCRTRMDGKFKEARKRTFLYLFTDK